MVMAVYISHDYNDYIFSKREVKSEIVISTDAKFRGQLCVRFFYKVHVHVPYSTRLPSQTFCNK